MAERQTENPYSLGAFLGRVRAHTTEVPADIRIPRIVLIASTAMLLGYGLMVIYSASSITNIYYISADAETTFLKQLQMVLAGLGAAIVFARVDYLTWSGWPVWVVRAVTLLLAILPHTPLASAANAANGADRWIELAGIQVQPSEFAKVGVVILMAAYISRWEKGEMPRLREARESMAALGDIASEFLGIVLPLAFIMKEPDYGSVLILAVAGLITLFAAGFPLRALAEIMVFFVFVSAFVLMLFPHTFARVSLFIEMFPLDFTTVDGDNYQMAHGLFAFARGGLFGTGLGNSIEKYGYLTQAESDFILATTGEELGLVGLVVLLALFVAFAWAGLRISAMATEPEGRTLAMCCTAVVMVQLLLNAMGVTALFPLSGKPVPFITAGGSSVISCLMLVGLMLSVSYRSRPRLTAAERRRALIHDADDEPGVTVARRPDSGYNRDGAARSGARGLTVVNGGTSGGRDSSRNAGRQRQRRLDLSEDPAERLRGDSGRTGRGGSSSADERR